jgi:hypothetical protein
VNWYRFWTGVAAAIGLMALFVHEEWERLRAAWINEKPAP